MNVGERYMSPIFGMITVDEVYESEDEARMAGYYYDAHVSALGYKVLGNLSRYSPVTPERSFAAARVLRDKD